MQPSSKIPLLIAQVVISLVLIVSGIYNCIVNTSMRPFWVSLIVFPAGLFLPHPELPKKVLELTNLDQIDGHQQRQNFLWVRFCIQIVLCLCLIGVGIYNLCVDSKDPIWTALVVFPLGCILPSPCTIVNHV